MPKGKSKDYLQKQALEEIMFRFFNKHPEKEKSYIWTSNKVVDKDLIRIKEKLENHRGYTFMSRKVSLRFDYVFEDEKIIIEFDERQHFTTPRALSLEFYPKDLKFGFKTSIWRKHSDSIQAKDNDPVFRDEQRAYYDSVRDIMASKNGYIVIRIKYNDFDWINKDNIEQFEKIIENAKEIYCN